MKLFTKRHYTLFSDAISNGMKGGRLTQSGAEFTAKFMADVFAKDNKGFNRSRFYAACKGENLAEEPANDQAGRDRRIVRMPHRRQRQMAAGHKED